MNPHDLKTQLNVTLLIILVLCRIALRALNGKTTHKFLTAVARNPASKDTLSQIV